MRMFSPSRLANKAVRLDRTFHYQNGNTCGALQLLNMQKGFSHLLRICAQNQSLSYGMSLHASILKTLKNVDLFLSNSLANMYSKCRCMEDALKVFDEISEPDVVSWNTIIAGYFLCWCKLHAFSYFKKMLYSAVVPDHVTLTSVFKGCISFGEFYVGLQVHCILTKFGLGENVFVGSGLVEFYANFNCFLESMEVFDGFVCKDIVLVNIMISILAKIGGFKEALDNFKWIMASSMVPTTASFVNLLSVIEGYEMLKEGGQIHGLVIKFGFDMDGATENSLVGMYVSCDAMTDAFELLVYLGSKNIISWTTLIYGYACDGCFQDAMDAFNHIYHEALFIDEVLIACIVSVSAASERLHLGTQIHSIALKIGFESEPSVRNSLMDMYAKCSFMEDTLKIFQYNIDRNDLLLWTTVITGYIHNGFPIEAMRHFNQMIKEGVTPDSVTCISVLIGCSEMEAIDQGTQVHAYAIKYAFDANTSVQTALLSLYLDCGRLVPALELFGNMVTRDIISWTALISGYSKLGYNEEALIFLTKMLREGVKPNHFTFVSALTACAKLTAMETGLMIHANIIKYGFENQKFIGCGLVDMYCKCGGIQDAINYFNEAPKTDKIMWNALLAGHAHYGNGLEVLKVFQDMQNHGVEPDDVTFLAVLSGCSHGRLAVHAVNYFLVMQDVYQIHATMEHHACVVDAFGRSGLFREAVEFIEGMKFEPGTVVLRTLLSSCIIHGCVKLGLAVAAKIMELGENDTATYVMLSNLYSVSERWEDAQKARETMEKKCLGGKEVGKSWIETKSRDMNNLHF